MLLLRLSLSALFLVAACAISTSIPHPAFADESGCGYQGQDYGVNSTVCMQHIVFTCEEGPQTDGGPANYGWQPIGITKC